MKPQSDVIATRLFRACEAIAAPILGAWSVTYGYNDMMGYWVRFSPHDMDAFAFAGLYFDRTAMIDGVLYTSHDCGFTRQDLIGCLLSVDAQAGKKLPK